MDVVVMARFAVFDHANVLDVIAHASEWFLLPERFLAEGLCDDLGNPAKVFFPIGPALLGLFPEVVEIGDD